MNDKKENNFSKMIEIRGKVHQNPVNNIVMVVYACYSTEKKDYFDVIV